MTTRYKIDDPELKDFPYETRPRIEIDDNPGRPPLNTGLIKGPFQCHEHETEDEAGNKRIALDVALLPRQYLKKHWLSKGTFPRAELDDENLPLLFWREIDIATYSHANAGINHAPRACFIWRSCFEGHKPYFVSVNFDHQGAVPEHLRNPALARRAAFIILGVCLAINAIYFFYEGLASNFSSGAWVLATAASINSAIFLAGCGLAVLLLAYIGIMDGVFGRSARWALGIDALVSLHIWRDRQSPELHRQGCPQAHIAPWRALQGFEILEEQDTPHNRTRIRASFGTAAPETDIVNGTMHRDTAREIQRLLARTFSENRSHFLNQIEDEPPRMLLAQANRTQKILDERARLSAGYGKASGQ
ncbi:MAG: hypothetical protein ACLPPF_13195 [Rhodomicrobium sp.]